MKEADIRSIIAHYRKFRQEHPDTWVDFTMQQSSLSAAVEVAALSVDAEGRRNPHQRRRSAQTLQAFRDALLPLIPQMRKATHFDQLFRIVDSVCIHDIGPLTKYDAAHRIGCFLNLLPDRVYLHNGALVGAQRLIGTRIKERCIRKELLPKPFHSQDINCADIEDILCIYKDRWIYSPNTYIKSTNHGCK